MFDSADIETEADVWYAAIEADPMDRLAPLDQLRRAPHVREVEMVWRPEWPYAWVEEDRDGLDVVTLHRGASLVALHWRAIGEGIEGLWRRREPPLVEELVKRYVSATAARVLMHRYPVRRALSELGLNIPALAAAFGVSQVAMALRLGEIKSLPVAVVGANAVKRGGAHGLPSNRDLVRVVRAGGGHGWQVVPLTAPRAWMVWPRDW